ARKREERDPVRDASYWKNTVGASEEGMGRLYDHNNISTPGKAGYEEDVMQTYDTFTFTINLKVYEEDVMQTYTFTFTINLEVDGLLLGDLQWRHYDLVGFSLIYVLRFIQILVHIDYDHNNISTPGKAGYEEGVMQTYDTFYLHDKPGGRWTTCLLLHLHDKPGGRWTTFGGPPG
ncbi:hypothetical protein Tco_1118224, partial [Tanacetum coccineum]